MVLYSHHCCLLNSNEFGCTCLNSNTKLQFIALKLFSLLVTVGPVAKSPGQRNYHHRMIG